MLKEISGKVCEVNVRKPCDMQAYTVGWAEGLGQQVRFYSCEII